MKMLDQLIEKLEKAGKFVPIYDKVGIECPEALKNMKIEQLDKKIDIIVYDKNPDVEFRRMALDVVKMYIPALDGIAPATQLIDYYLVYNNEVYNIHGDIICLDGAYYIHKELIKLKVNNRT